MEYFAPLRVMCTTKNEGNIKKSYYTSCKRQKSSDCLLAGSIRIPCTVTWTTKPNHQTYKYLSHQTALFWTDSLCQILLLLKAIEKRQTA